MYTVGTLYKSIDAMAAQKDADQKATFLSHHDSKLRRHYKEVQKLLRTEGKLSTAQQLREIRLQLTESNHSEAVEKFYDHMPAAVEEYDKWKSEVFNLNVRATEAGKFLTMMFTGEYPDEEVYEEFTSESFTKEVEQLISVIALNKIFDGMKLAEDAVRDFSWWEQRHKEVSSIGAAATSTVGSMGVMGGAALNAPAVVAGSVALALPMASFQLYFGWNQAASCKKDKNYLKDIAITVSDILEITQRDVRLLDEIGVYAANIATCQQKVQRTGRINKLQRDRMLHSAEKLEEACERCSNSLFQDSEEEKPV